MGNKENVVANSTHAKNYIKENIKTAIRPPTADPLRATQTRFEAEQENI